MFALSSLQDAQKVLTSFIENKDNVEKINSAINMMVESYKNNGRMFSCGNGGSMCDAMHFAEELTGRFRKERAPLAAMAINDPSHLTCVSNDYGYDVVFSRYVEAWGNKGDVLLAISTSGNSPNVLLAAEAARKKGMKVIGLLGKDGGKLKNMVDVAIVVDSPVSDRIQEVHIKCIHIFIEGIERSMFPENY
ncbi:D-sedoheptulose 7-phosphate isomerase [Bacteriovorax sp. PP10]|uniref:Phosphoheptose isomerase n=1 Tax=Bacteriovorax antarcticus TaxID=3088717 RepID=A0ABU5VUB4_9BACT|nr:D-sedoheptulose 7-phosphate isomerase [Bacteriovorax sp. PP10]MEA9356566.1 D-sedoheptulose 7-phosphate isomerase [Bacteriovorax sp. PP10]